MVLRSGRPSSSSSSSLSSSAAPPASPPRTIRRFPIEMIVEIIIHRWDSPAFLALVARETLAIRARVLRAEFASTRMREFASRSSNVSARVLEADEKSTGRGAASHRGETSLAFREALKIQAARSPCLPSPPPPAFSFNIRHAREKRTARVTRRFAFLDGAMKTLATGLCRDRARRGIAC